MPDAPDESRADAVSDAESDDDADGDGPRGDGDEARANGSGIVEGAPPAIRWPPAADRPLGAEGDKERVRDSGPSAGAGRVAVCRSAPP